MVTFKCKLSGNTVSFTNPLDIECLRKDPNYDEVKNEIQAKSENSSNRPDGEDEGQEGNGKEEAGKEEVLKKRGRPAKK